MDTKHKGAHSELLATAWLLQNGYDVFRNVSAHGLVDIVAIHIETRQWLVIDVRSTSRTNNKGPSSYAMRKLSQAQVDFGVVPLYVYPCGTVTFEYSRFGPGIPDELHSLPNLNNLPPVP